AFGEGDQVGRRLLVQLGQGDAAVGDDRLAVVLLLLVRLLIDHGQIGGGRLVGRLIGFRGLGLGGGRIGVADVGHGNLLQACAPGRSRGGEVGTAVDVWPRGRRGNDGLRPYRRPASLGERDRPARARIGSPPAKPRRRDQVKRDRTGPRRKRNLFLVRP